MDPRTRKLEPAVTGLCDRHLELRTWWSWRQLKTIITRWSRWGGLVTHTTRTHTDTSTIVTAGLLSYYLLKIEVCRRPAKGKLLQESGDKCCGDVTLCVQFSGGEQEINKSGIGWTNRGDSPAKLKTFNIHQLYREMQRVARSDTRYNFVQIMIFFCHTTPTGVLHEHHCIARSWCLGY